MREKGLFPTTLGVVENNSLYDFPQQMILISFSGLFNRIKPYLIAISTYVATDRHDLTAEQIASVYKLRWTVENFFKWWKEHLKVYHLIARSEYGFMVQILGGLITYLLLAIHCWEQFNEKVSIKRVRQLRTTILNELFGNVDDAPPNLSWDNIVKDQKTIVQAKT